jgi:hypothetical protein
MIERPPDRSFIHAKGMWQFSGSGTSPLQRFAVSEFVVIKPDIGDMRPDITFHDFQEIVFEGLTVEKYRDDTLTELLAYNLISSPTSLGRAGGLTFSLYNEYDADKRGQSWLIQKYLTRSLPKEVIASSGYHLSVEGLDEMVTLEPFHWRYASVNGDTSIPEKVSSKLGRPSAFSLSSPSYEISISAYTRRSRPKKMTDPVVTLADAPIVIARDIITKPGIFDPDPRIFQFIVASHMVQVALPASVQEESIRYVQKALMDLQDEYPLLKTEYGKGRMLDLSVHGRPLSLLHLGLSNGRSSITSEISLETIKKAIQLYRHNVDDVMKVWEDAFPEAGEFNLAGIAPEERKIIAYIIRNGPSSMEEIFQSCKQEMSEAVFIRMWNSVYNGGLIFEKSNGIFDIVPNIRDLK